MDGDLLLKCSYLLFISRDKLSRRPRLLGNARFQLRNAEVFEIVVDLPIPIPSPPKSRYFSAAAPTY